MTWGTFTKAHIATLILGVAIHVALYFLLVNKSRRMQIITLFFLSLAGVSAVAYNLLALGSPWENLPLNLYSLNALLLPFAILFRKKRSCNLLLLWSAASALALIFNEQAAGLDILSFEFLMYYLPHVLGAGIPILLFALGLAEKDFRSIKSTLVLTLAAYTAIHFVNVAINNAKLLNSAGEIIKVSYMCSIFRPGIESANPLYNIFHLLITCDYWYMFLLLPIILIYLGWWYLPELIDYRKETATMRKKLKAVDRYYKEYEEEYIDEIIDEKFDD